MVIPVDVQHLLALHTQHTGAKLVSVMPTRSVVEVYDMSYPDKIHSVKPNPRRGSQHWGAFLSHTVGENILSLDPALRGKEGRRTGAQHDDVVLRSDLVHDEEIGLPC
jgi:hypothetical protein